MFRLLEVGDTSSRLDKRFYTNLCGVTASRPVSCAKHFTNKDLAATQESLHTTQPLRIGLSPFGPFWVCVELARKLSFGCLGYIVIQSPE